MRDHEYVLHSVIQIRIRYPQIPSRTPYEVERLLVELFEAWRGRGGFRLRARNPSHEAKSVRSCSPAPTPEERASP